MHGVKDVPRLSGVRARPWQNPMRSACSIRPRPTESYAYCEGNACLPGSVLLPVDTALQQLLAP